VIPVARITERVAVKTSGNEIVQAVEILRGELIVRELDVSDGHVGGTELRMSGECVVRGSQAAGGRCLSGIMRGSQAAGGHCLSGIMCGSQAAGGRCLSGIMRGSCLSGIVFSSQAAGRVAMNR
jgi:hypothetical protein